MKNVIVLAWLPSSNEKEHLIILEKQNYTWKARAKVKEVDFNLSLSSIYWVNRWIEQTKRKCWMHFFGWGNGRIDDIIFPLKTQKPATRV